MLLSTGVMSDQSDIGVTTAMQPTEIVAHGVAERPVRFLVVVLDEAVDVRVRHRARECHRLDALEDLVLVLVDDGEAYALPGRIGQPVVDEDRATHVEHRHQQQHDDREHEGELDETPGPSTAHDVEESTRVTGPP